MKRRTRDSVEDPAIAEIRAARARIWRKAGGSGAGLMRLLREAMQASKPAKRARRNGRPASRRHAATPRPRKRQA